MHAFFYLCLLSNAATLAGFFAGIVGNDLKVALICLFVSFAAVMAMPWVLL